MMPMIMPDGSLWLTTGEIAAVAGCSRQTVWIAVRAKEIPAVDYRKTHLAANLIRPEDAEAWMWQRGYVANGQKIAW